MKTDHVARFPPKKILVPLDLSDASTIAWKEATSLAKRFDAKVKGLYVQPWLYSAMGTGTPLDPEGMVRASQAALKELRSRFGPEADLGAVPGAVEATILSWGKEGFDLIVMGHHGHTGLERVLKGSISETIVRHSSIPVLVTHGPVSRFRSVLAPVNFRPYALDGLFSAARIAEMFGARLTVLHVIDHPFYGDVSALQGPKALLANWIDRLPESVRKACRPRTQMVFGNAAEEIVLESRDADLIVLVAHRKGFLSDTILGTTVERVLRHSSRPVLAIPFGTPMRGIGRQTAARPQHRDAAIAS